MRIEEDGAGVGSGSFFRRGGENGLVWAIWREGKSAFEMECGEGPGGRKSHTEAQRHGETEVENTKGTKSTKSAGDSSHGCGYSAGVPARISTGL